MSSSSESWLRFTLFATPACAASIAIMPRSFFLSRPPKQNIQLEMFSSHVHSNYTYIRWNVELQLQLGFQSLQLMLSHAKGQEPVRNFYISVISHEVDGIHGSVRVAPINDDNKLAPQRRMLKQVVQSHGSSAQSDKIQKFQTVSDFQDNGLTKSVHCRLMLQLE